DPPPPGARPSLSGDRFPCKVDNRVAVAEHLAENPGGSICCQDLNIGTEAVARPKGESRPGHDSVAIALQARYQSTSDEACGARYEDPHGLNVDKIARVLSACTPCSAPLWQRSSSCSRSWPRNPRLSGWCVEYLSVPPTAPALRSAAW